jgi:uncharacterized coiled-coil protein SlyX
MNKPRRSDAEITAKLKEVLDGAYVDASHRANYCEYKGDKNRYCRITTQSTCKGCRFFSPNMLMRSRVVVEQYEDLESEIDSLNKKVNEQRNLLEQQKTQLDNVRYENAVLQEGFCESRKKCVPADEHFDGIEVYKPNKKQKKAKILVG